MRIKNTNHLIILIISISIILIITILNLYNTENESPTDHNKTDETDSFYVYNYSIIKTYPHDPNAYTQGIVYYNGYIYESTGIYGRSSLRKVDLQSGEVVQIYNLSSEFFGEGIAIHENRIIQLTWLSNTGFVYDKDSFELIEQFNYPTQGWGLTFDGDNLIMSDGTSTLLFLNPITFEEIKKVNVSHKNNPLDSLNELEYINGKIYSNIYQTDYIAIIEPYSGNITGLINLTGIINSLDYEQELDVLNGIAYDNENNRLFVTGKLWPYIFEIKII